MKKFFWLLLVVVVVVMTSSFVGVVFANMVLEKNNEHSTQLVVVEATATPSATVEPTAEATVTVEPTATPIAGPTATPIVEATATPTVEPTIEQTATVEPTSKDQSQISWDDFFAKSRYVDGSFNAIYDGQEVGRINFTDEDLMAHVGEELAINVASTSVSVKLEGKRHVYKAASVQQPDLAVCSKHTALYRRHTSAYGDDIVITLTAEDITNIAKYAAYWYNQDGELVYGVVICDCLVARKSGTSNGSNSNVGSEPTETSRPAVDNTPVPPADEATNKPGHSDPVVPQPVVKNTPPAPAPDYVGENHTQHNEQLNAANGAEESDGNPSHSDLLGAEEVSEGTASAVADAVSAPEAPSADFVASVASNDVPVAPANDLVASIPAAEAPAPVVEVDKVDVDEAMNVPSFSDMPTE